MRTFLLAAVTLQLLTSVFGATPEYTFGDMIAFPRKILCNCKMITYFHYAVYVGDKPFEGTNKKADDDMFQYIGLVNLIPPINCVFGKINPKENPSIYNYLDGKHYVKDSDDVIIKRIYEKYHKCSGYRLFSNNCEHLATYVRYGVPISLQLGASPSVSSKCLNGPNHDFAGTNEILNKIALLENPDDICSITCPAKPK